MNIYITLYIIDSMVYLSPLFYFFLVGDIILDKKNVNLFFSFLIYFAFEIIFLLDGLVSTNIYRRHSAYDGDYLYNGW